MLATILVYVLSRPPRGGRGLKYSNSQLDKLLLLSPSSRRAWIEIIEEPFKITMVKVALLAEGVD